MRKLVADLGRDKRVVCAAYARSERDGQVKRARDANETTPESYAAALWNDGDRKGWL